MTLPEIILYSKPGCCLCEKVKDQLTDLQQQQQFTLHEVNILEDSKIYQSFKDEIPVVFINGKKAFTYRLDEREFVKLLTSDDYKQSENTTSTAQ